MLKALDQFAKNIFGATKEKESPVEKSSVCFVCCKRIRVGDVRIIMYFRSIYLADNLCSESCYVKYCQKCNQGADIDILDDFRKELAHEKHF